MAVKIITDSLSDITSDLAEKLGVTIVPLTVFFGHESFLDRVTITTDEFYRRLIHGNVLPTTTQPAPGVFADVYKELAKETDEILVITLSSKLSGTYQSAMNAKEMVGNKCRIEVIDSQTVAMGLGLVVIATAGSQYEKIINNISEVRSRGGSVIAIATEGDREIEKLAERVLHVPDTLEPLQPLLTVIPLQLIAYHAAVLRGCNVDKPRNLAKSVTVE